MKAGDHIYISNGRTGCSGDVISVTEPKDLPAIPNAPPHSLVQAILAETAIDKLALITYNPNGKGSLSFFALHNTRTDTWMDLQGTTLTLTDLSPDATTRKEAPKA